MAVVSILTNFSINPIAAIACNYLQALSILRFLDLTGAMAITDNPVILAIIDVPINLVHLLIIVMMIGSTPKTTMAIQGAMMSTATTRMRLFTQMKKISTLGACHKRQTMDSPRVTAEEELGNGELLAVVRMELTVEPLKVGHLMLGQRVVMMSLLLVGPFEAGLLGLAQLVVVMPLVLVGPPVEIRLLPTVGPFGHLGVGHLKLG